MQLGMVKWCAVGINFFKHRTVEPLWVFYIRLENIKECAVHVISLYIDPSIGITFYWKILCKCRRKRWKIYLHEYISEPHTQFYMVEWETLLENFSCANHCNYFEYIIMVVMSNSFHNFMLDWYCTLSIKHLFVFDIF